MEKEVNYCDMYETVKKFILQDEFSTGQYPEENAERVKTAIEAIMIRAKEEGVWNHPIPINSRSYELTQSLEGMNQNEK